MVELVQFSWRSTERRHHKNARFLVRQRVKKCDIATVRRPDGKEIEPEVACDLKRLVHPQLPDIDVGALLLIALPGVNDFIAVRRERALREFSGVSGEWHQPNGFVSGATGRARRTKPERQSQSQNKAESPRSPELPMIIRMMRTRAVPTRLRRGCVRLN